MAKARASLAGVTVSFGVINFSVDLVPATRAKADKRSAESVSLTRVCPTCTDGVRIKQRLYCEKDHGPFSQTALDSAVEVDGKLRKVPAAEVEAVNEPAVDAKSVAFSVFPAGELERATMPSGNVYRMRLPARPTKATVQAYALMLELVADGDHAFLAELVVKGVTKLYRGIARDGMITLTELYRPSIFHEADGAEVACEDRMVAAGRAMAAEMVETFDPAGWESAAQERLAALQAAAVAGSESTEPTEIRAATAAAEDLLGLLQRAAA